MIAAPRAARARRGSEAVGRARTGIARRAITATRVALGSLRRTRWLAILATLLALAAPARADIVRHAVVIGANQGARGEARLRFAESDADRVAEVLADLGDFPAENQAILRGKSAAVVRRALITVNDRIRTTHREGERSVLVVYYSGHADASALHLGDDALELAEVEALVRGSPADVRVLVIDACRSGALTRVKGGRPAPPVALDREPLGEGLVFLTSSAAGEDAQESDEVGGSFFTHFLTSGLLGAADRDGDGEVTLGEAFQFAREQTIVASSRTLAGVQHPTFRYELRGRADLTLTRPGRASQRAALTLPPGLDWLVIRDGAAGRVVAEVSATAARRTLSLRPGAYFVRGRGSDALYEGTVRIDTAHTVALSALDRIAYARLVRKGGPRESSQAWLAGAVVRSGLVSGEEPCLGALAGWAWDLPQITISPRLAFCRSTMDAALRSTTDALGGELRVSHAWDLPRVTLDLGATAGAEAWRTRYDTTRTAPSRTTAAGHLDVSLGAATAGSLYLWAELALQTYVFRKGNEGDGTTVAQAAARGVIGLGVRR